MSKKNNNDIIIFLINKNGKLKKFNIYTFPSIDEPLLYDISIDLEAKMYEKIGRTIEFQIGS